MDLSQKDEGCWPALPNPPCSITQRRAGIEISDENTVVSGRPLIISQCWDGSLNRFIQPVRY